MLTHINPDTLAPSAGNSQVVVSEMPRTAFLSGQIAVDSSGAVVGAADFRAQLRQVLSNIDLALASAGTSRENVLKLTIYVVDLDTAEHGPVLSELLGDLASFAHPAATLLSVAGLARPDLMVEIDVIAAAP